MNAWVLLSLAIGLEIAGTFFLKLSNGFEKWQFGTVSIVLFMACFTVLAPAMKSLPVGVVYAVWSGVGIVAASLIGVMVFKETLNLMQIACISMILIGAVSLKITTS